MSACGSPSPTLEDDAAEEVGSGAEHDAPGQLDPEAGADPAAVFDAWQSELVVVPPPMRLSWAGVTDASDAVLTDAHASLRVINDSDQEITVALDWVGDLGTTKAHFGSLADVVVGPLAEVQVDVDLDTLFSTLDTDYSGQVQVAGQILGLPPAERPNQVTSAALYFHQEASGRVLGYSEAGLHDLHRAGDFDGLDPQTESLVDAANDSHTVRVVGYEPDDEGPQEAAPGAADSPANGGSYIRLRSTTCTAHDQRNKFVVAHELGHSYAYLNAGVSGHGAADDHSATPEGDCEFTKNGSPYYNLTKEWSSLALREGFAHFYSARVWNDEAADGQFRWDQSWDLERFDSGDDDGGYLVNACCTAGKHGTATECEASLDGAGVLTDWMRALWDQHTDGTCPFDKSEIAAMYDSALNGSLDDDNAWDETASYAATQGGTCEARWEANGCHNGIDREGALWSGC